MGSSSIPPLILLLCLSSTVTVWVDAALRKEPAMESSCSFNAQTDALTCKLRTLDGGNATSASSHGDSGDVGGLFSPSMKKARSVSITCSDVFFYESVLRTNHFGHLANLRKLTLDSCKIRRVPSLAFSGLSGLKSLELRSRNSEWSAMVMELEQDALIGLDQLRRLNMTENNIWTLPESVLCGLDNLRVLNLSHNFIQAPADLGFSQTKLRSCRLPLKLLDLSHNSIAVLPRAVFGQLSRLDTLLLEGNNVNILEDDALEGMGALFSLNLANNQLVALPPEVFRYTRQLRHLQLQNNSLSALAPGLFSGLEQMLTLNMSRNGLTSDWVGASTFNSLRRLVALDLSHNRLTRFDGQTFASLTSLQVLNLDHNAVHTLAPNAFRSLRSLKILRLSHNALSSVRSRSLQSLGQLSSLSLDHNNLRGLDGDTLKNCTTLQDLALHGNQLEDVPAAIRELPLIRTLHLGSNRITRVRNGSFDGLSHLYGLSLAGNDIVEVESGAFKSVPELQALNLAHNSLSQLHQSVFNALKKLKTLRLDGNALEDINGLLTSQSELHWLNVSSNRLAWFDYAFVPRSVRWLDLHDNLVEELGNYYKLSSGFDLVTLDASDNKIKALNPLSLPGSLRYLLLNGNAISSIESRTFADIPHLQRVELKNNKLRTMKPAAVAVTVDDWEQGQPQQKGKDNPLPEFYLAGNPFLCDCEMEWLQKINQMSSPGGNTYPRVMDLESVQCDLDAGDGNLIAGGSNASGQATASVSIARLRSDQFLCRYEAHCFALCMCCEFFACDCRMQCPKGCSCHHDSTWSANIIQCSSRGHLDVPPLIPMDATSIRLDGNNFTGTLESQAFIGRKRVTSLYLNGSQIEAISNQTFNGLPELQILDLSHNFIRKLKGYEFSNLSSLHQLYLQHNRLVQIHPRTFSSLVALQELHLEGNQLAVYPVWNLQSLPELGYVFLAGNAWSCQCDFVNRFMEFSRTGLISDSRLVECYSSEKEAFLPLNDNVTCSDALAVTYQDGGGDGDEANVSSQNILPILIGIIAVCVVLVCTSVVLFVFRTPLRVWLHSKYGIRVFGKTRQDKLYDAFVSYSAKDEAFVQQVMVPQLEHDDPGYKLCLQYRDLPSNSSIADTFPGVSHLCDRHVLVVSKSYLAAEWPQMRCALQNFAKKLRPVVIFLEELSSLDLAAAPELNLLLKTSVSLRWNETGFWNKLRFYLPDAREASATTRGGSTRLQPHPGAKYFTSATGGGNGNGGSAKDWPYDPVVTSNDSSAASTRSTIMGGSPRANDQQQQLQQQSGQQIQLLQSQSSPQKQPLQQWPQSDGSDSAYSWQPSDHLYQAVANAGSEHIYHMVDPEQVGGVGSGGDADLSHSHQVLLSNGQLVGTTLVRNPRTGKVMTMVPLESVVHSQSAAASEERQPLHMQQVTFPRTVLYRPEQQQQGHLTQRPLQPQPQIQPRHQHGRGHLV